MEAVLTALGAAIPVGAVMLVAIVRARRFAAEGGQQAQSDLAAIQKAMVDALTAENARLRTDLAGCESENRGLRRQIRDD